MLAQVKLSEEFQDICNDNKRKHLMSAQRFYCFITATKNMLIFDSKYGNKYFWSNLLTQQFVLNFFKPKWFFFVYLYLSDFQN